MIDFNNSQLISHKTREYYSSTTMWPEIITDNVTYHCSIQTDANPVTNHPPAE